MRKTIAVAFCAISLATAQTERDTLWFDPQSGNYIIQYIGVGDTVVTVVFEPATKIDPIITAAVRLQKNEDTLTYEYSIKNGEKSKQNLVSFEIEYKAEVSDNTTNGWYSRKIFDGKIEDDRWFTFDAMRWRWSGDQGLERGWSVSGFVLKSNGLPGIVNAYFQGLAAEYGTPDGGPFSDLHLEILKLMDFPTNYVSRRAIGPVLPPSPFIPLAFLDTLLSYTRQSAALGWLAPPGQGRDRDEDSDEDEKPEHGLVRNIEQRLNKAKRELQRQDSVKARRELEKLVKKVERVWKRSQDEEKRGRKQRMTSEAYALLKYNTEYLIDRLPKKKGEKDYDDKEDR
jgi:hypothetical protein